MVFAHVSAAFMFVAAAGAWTPGPLAANANGLSAQGSGDDAPAGGARPPSSSPGGAPAPAAATGTPFASVPSDAKVRTPPQLRLFLAGSTHQGLDVVSDGHFDEAPDLSGGLHAEVVMAPWRALRWGIGLHYELAHVPSRFGNPTGLDHFGSLLGLLGGAIPVARGHEIELLAGFGPAVGLMRGGEVAAGDTFMRSVGVTAEAAITYWKSITRGFDLSIGALAAFSLLTVQNGGGYFEQSPVAHGVAVLRVGARWPL